MLSPIAHQLPDLASSLQEKIPLLKNYREQRPKSSTDILTFHRSASIDWIPLSDQKRSVIDTWFGRSSLIVAPLSDYNFIPEEASLWTRFDVPPHDSGKDGSFFQPTATILDRSPINQTDYPLPSWRFALSSIQSRRKALHRTGYRKEDLDLAFGAIFEFDEVQNEDQRFEEIIAKILKLASIWGNPFYVVYSGGKSLHAAWRFDEPIDLRTADREKLISEYEHHYRVIADQIGSDRKCFDIGHEMRTPGFCGQFSEQPNERSQPILYFDPDQTITYRDWIERSERWIEAERGSFPTIEPEKRASRPITKGSLFSIEDLPQIAKDQIERSFDRAICAQDGRRQIYRNTIRFIARKCAENDLRFDGSEIIERMISIADQSGFLIKHEFTGSKIGKIKKEWSSAWISAQDETPTKYHHRSRRDEIYQEARSDRESRFIFDPFPASSSIEQRSEPEIEKIAMRSGSIADPKIEQGSEPEIEPERIIADPSIEDPISPEIRNPSRPMLDPSIMTDTELAQDMRAALAKIGASRSVAKGEQGDHGWIIADQDLDQFTWLKIRTGSGKTELCKRIVAKLSISEEKRVLWIVAKRCLGKVTADETGSEFYLSLDAKTGQYEKIRSKDLKSDKLTSHLVICVNSLWRLEGRKPYDLIIMDEWSEILSSQISFSQMTQTKPKQSETLFKSFQLLRKWIGSGETKCIFCDAEAEPGSMMDLASFLPSSAHLSVIETPDDVMTYQGKKLSFITDREFGSALIDQFKEGRSVAIYDRKKTACQRIGTLCDLILEALDQDGEGEIYTAKTPLKESIGDDTIGRWRSLRWIAMNSTIGSGISYKGSHFETVFVREGPWGWGHKGEEGTFPAGYREFLQALHRCRGVKNIVIVLCDKERKIEEDEATIEDLIRKHRVAQEDHKKRLKKRNPNLISEDELIFARSVALELYAIRTGKRNAIERIKNELIRYGAELIDYKPTIIPSLTDLKIDGRGSKEEDLDESFAKMRETLSPEKVRSDIEKIIEKISGSSIDEAIERKKLLIGRMGYRVEPEAWDRRNELASLALAILRPEYLSEMEERELAPEGRLDQLKRTSRFERSILKLALIEQLDPDFSAKIRSAIAITEPEQAELPWILDRAMKIPSISITRDRDRWIEIGDDLSEKRFRFASLHAIDDARSFAHLDPLSDDCGRIKYAIREIGSILGSGFSAKRCKQSKLRDRTIYRIDYDRIIEQIIEIAPSISKMIGATIEDQGEAELIGKDERAALRFCAQIDAMREALNTDKEPETEPKIDPKIEQGTEPEIEKIAKEEEEGSSADPKIVASSEQEIATEPRLLDPSAHDPSLSADHAEWIEELLRAERRAGIYRRERPIALDTRSDIASQLDQIEQSSQGATSDEIAMMIAKMRKRIGLLIWRADRIFIHGQRITFPSSVHRVPIWIEQKPMIRGSGDRDCAELIDGAQVLFYLIRKRIFFDPDRVKDRELFTVCMELISALRSRGNGQKVQSMLDAMEQRTIEIEQLIEALDHAIETINRKIEQKIERKKRDRWITRSIRSADRTFIP